MSYQKLCLIMVGVPGSGKSTAIKKLNGLLGGGEYVVFSLDALRLKFMDASHPGQWWSDVDTEASKYAQAWEFAKQNSKAFDKFVTESWNAALKSDRVFVDNINISKKSRTRWATEARAKEFKIIGVEVCVPLKVAIARQATRGDKHVPEALVAQFFMQQQSLMLGTEVDHVLYVNGETSEVYGDDLSAVL